MFGLSLQVSNNTYVSALANSPFFFLKGQIVVEPMYGYTYPIIALLNLSQGWLWGFFQFSLSFNQSWGGIYNFQVETTNKKVSLAMNMIFLAFSSDRFNIFYIEAAFGLESIVLYLFVKQINEKNLMTQSQSSILT